MVKNICFNCEKEEIKGYVGQRHFPLCEACVQLMLKNKLTLEELEEKFQKEKK